MSIEGINRGDSRTITIQTSSDTDSLLRNNRSWKDGRCWSILRSSVDTCCEGAGICCEHVANCYIRFCHSIPYLIGLGGTASTIAGAVLWGQGTLPLGPILLFGGLIGISVSCTNVFCEDCNIASDS